MHAKQINVFQMDNVYRDFSSTQSFQNKMFDYGRSNFLVLYIIITDLNIVLTSLLQSGT